MSLAELSGSTSGISLTEINKKLRERSWYSWLTVLGASAVMLAGCGKTASQPAETHSTPATTTTLTPSPEVSPTASASSTPEVSSITSDSCEYEGITVPMSKEDVENIIKGIDFQVGLVKEDVQSCLLSIVAYNDRQALKKAHITKSAAEVEISYRQVQIAALKEYRRTFPDSFNSNNEILELNMAKSMFKADKMLFYNTADDAGPDYSIDINLDIAGTQLDSNYLLSFIGTSQQFESWYKDGTLQRNIDTCKAILKSTPHPNPQDEYKNAIKLALNTTALGMAQSSLSGE